MFKTRYSSNDLLNLGLSETLARFVMEEPRTGIFEFWCEDKYGGWLCHIPAEITAIYPLWSCNANLTVVWLRQGKREFVKTFHDDPEHILLASTEQGFLAQLFHTLMESQNWNTPSEIAHSESQLLEAAAGLNFEYMREFLDLYAQSVKDPDGYNEKIEKLISTIDNQKP